MKTKKPKQDPRDIIGDELYFCFQQIESRGVRLKDFYPAYVVMGICAHLVYQYVGKEKLFELLEEIKENICKQEKKRSSS